MTILDIRPSEDIPELLRQTPHPRPQGESTGERWRHRTKDGELILRQDGHDSTSEAVGGLYWRFEQWIRKCEAICDSPVGVYGGFYAIRRELFIRQPVGDRKS